MLYAFNCFGIFAFLSAGLVLLLTSAYPEGLLIAYMLFLAPVIVLLMNLWWVWLLVIPFVALAGQGRWRLGIVWTVVLAGFLHLAFLAVRSYALTGIPAAAAHVDDIALAKEPVRSAELIYDRASWPEGGACDPLCEQMLKGGFDWLRVSAAGAGASHLIARRPQEECLALDADFPADAACILYAPDHGLPPDIVLTESQSQIDVDRKGGGIQLAQLTDSRRLTISKGPGGVVLFDGQSNGWRQAASLVPLFPNVWGLTTGKVGAEIQIPMQRGSDPALDPAAALVQLGLAPLPAPRPLITYDGGSYSVRYTISHLQDSPADTALILSLLLLPLESWGKGGADQIGRWFSGVERGTLPATPALRQALSEVSSIGRPVLQGLDTLMARRPDLFVDDSSEFYRIVMDGRDDESRVAAAALLKTVLRDPLGSHDKDAGSYLVALESGRQNGILIRIVGRYGFDPTPLLRAEMAASVGKSDPPLYTIFGAACRSDPKWAGTIAPFVYGLMLPLAEDPLRRQYPGYTGHMRFKDSFKAGVQALRRMGREDLVEDLRARANWDDVVAAYNKEANHDNRSDVVLRGFFGNPDRDPECR